MTEDQLKLAESRGWTVFRNVVPANDPSMSCTYLSWMWPGEYSSRAVYIGYRNDKGLTTWEVHLLTSMPIEDMKYALRRMTRRRPHGGGR